MIAKGVGTALYVVWESKDARKESASTYDRDEALSLLMDLKRKEESAYIAVHRICHGPMGMYTETGFFDEYIEDVDTQDAVDILERQAQEAELEASQCRKKIAELKGKEAKKVSAVSMKPYFFANYLCEHGWQPDHSARWSSGQDIFMKYDDMYFVRIPCFAGKSYLREMSYGEQMEHSLCVASRVLGISKEEIVKDVLQRQNLISSIVGD